MTPQPDDGMTGLRDAARTERLSGWAVERFVSRLLRRHGGTAARRDPARCTLHAARTVLLLTLAVAPVAAQTPQQLELLRNNPDLVRQRIAQSGLSADEIRSRLQQAGYSSTLLDPFLSAEPGVASQAAVDARMLQALDALGVPVVTAEGLEPVPTAVGMQPTARGAAGAEGTGLQLFGLNVFQGRTSQFQPLLSGPVPANYKVGPGDELVLVITGDVELVHELTVTREGFIVIPQVGQISVNGLTMDDLTALLRRRLGQSYSGIRTGTTRFDVTVSRLRTNQVFVVGEVAQPGAYQLASVATVLNGLYAAGGPTQQGDFRDVLVRRQGDTVAVMDLYEYLLSGDTRNDIILEQGDVVFVPLREQRVSITGAVVRPAIYEIKPNERLNDLITMAGGFRPEAELTRVTVHRILPRAQRGPGPVPRTAIDVPLEQSDSETSVVTAPRFSLEPGDSVVVDNIPAPEKALYVSVFGMVRKPGRYPWSDGMTLHDLVRLAGGPTVGADLRQAEMARLPAERTTGDLAETFKAPLDSSYLFERDSQGHYLGPPGMVFPGAGSAPEVMLQPFDQATIFRQPEFELQRTVEIAGEVAYPGTYALTSKEEHVSDLVDRAGGLLPTAYPGGARFVRGAGAAGRIGIDLEGILAQPQGAEDVILQPGDSLEIPEYIPTVRVEGAVVSPASVLYREGATVDYYVGNAGGYARNADEGRVSVRYANGSAEVKRTFLFFSSTPRPGPGSVVTVPRKPEAQPINQTQLFSSVAQILASAVALVVVATR